MTDIATKVIEQLNQWIDYKLPQSIYIYGEEGEFYIRWTPSIPAKFTLANITIYEKYRGKGIFKKILEQCCLTTVPVIRLECIQNKLLQELPNILDVGLLRLVQDSHQ